MGRGGGLWLVCGRSVGLVVDTLATLRDDGRELAIVLAEQRVGMNARPNRYDELTDLQRVMADRLINAIASGRRVEDTADGGFSVGGWMSA
jgi:hypothetical protein